MADETPKSNESQANCKTLGGSESKHLFPNKARLEVYDQSSGQWTCPIAENFS